MPSSVSDSNANAISVPLPPATNLPVGELWLVYYRHQNSVFNFKGFQHKGSIDDARRRAERHCQIMGYKMIFLKPLIANIDEEEDIMTGKRQGQ